MFRLLVILGTALAVFAQVQDQTLTPNAHGSEVVDAVVSRIRNSCVFPDFKLFLRRLAFVTSKDGDAANTFRAGYDGGIWQIDKATFERIRTSTKLAPLLPKVNQQFGVTWSNVVWSDLRKPLYSGLAAALYLTSLATAVPRMTEDQAPFYKTYFKNTPDAAHNYFVAVQSLTAQTCPRTNLDLAFVVDGSSSLGRADFENAIEFAGKVVDNFKIGPNDVRIAFVTFSTGYKSEFNFNSFTDTAAVKNAIKGIQKPEGRTDTDVVLDFVTDHLFTPALGSRDGASKVILLLTDGQSTHRAQTLAAAAKARSKGIILYTIGVGLTDTAELTDIASIPKCTHVISLSGYSDLSALVNQIQKVSCETAAVLTHGTYRYTCSKGGIYQIITNGQLTQVTITVSDGKVDIYGSLTNSVPGPVVHSFQSVSQIGTSSVILIDQERSPVYFTVNPSGPPNGCTGTFTIKVGSVEMVKPNTLVTCVDHDRPRSCSVVEIYGRFYTLISPPYGFVNPCSVGQTKFLVHPTDQTRFLFCSVNATVYSFFCGAGHIFSAATLTCIIGTPTIVTPSTTPRTTSSPLGFQNPCLNQTLQTFFPYPPDESKYIDCTNWPTLGFIKSCPRGKTWDQSHLTCTYKYPYNPVTKKYVQIKNPCRNSLRDGDLFFYSYPNDPTKFIHCDQFGDAFIKDCPKSHIWSQIVLVCVPGGFPIG